MVIKVGKGMVGEKTNLNVRGCRRIQNLFLRFLFLCSWRERRPSEQSQRYLP